jgi:hypothetical protein
MHQPKLRGELSVTLRASSPRITLSSSLSIHNYSHSKQVRNFVLTNENETIIDFNAHLSDTYHIIPASIRPNVVMDLIYYLETFDGIFIMFLRDKDHAFASD